MIKPMIALQTITAICLFLFHFSSMAAWNLNTEGKKGIYVSNADKHQLSIVENKNGVDFYISVDAGRPISSPRTATISISDLTQKVDELQLIDQIASKSIYMLKLSRKQQTTLLNKMISELEVVVKLVGSSTKKLWTTKFTLIGFTASLNDFMIAREIEKLDYEWLLENHKDRELLCYYAANVYVRALLDRMKGGSYKKTMDSLPSTGIEKLDSVTGEMVENVYSIPERRLPADPRGDKYGIFKSCMSKAN